MTRSIFRLGLALASLCFFLSTSPFASAQISPTTAASITGSVSDSTGKPVVDAKVSLSGPKTGSTQTDASGSFVFIGVPFGTYSITAAAAGLGTATRAGISVQGDTNVAIQYAPTGGPKVIANVTSTSQAVFNVTPASITQVSPQAHAFEGQTSWRKILEQIPGVAQAGLGNGNNGLFFNAMPDGPFVPVQISINGTLPYETATLLDDMPLIAGNCVGGGRAPGNGTDLGNYPLNGFGAADVIRGPGANAPSIVDSIGGSFVLHAPGVVDHNHYDLSVSTDPYGGIVANAQAAVRWKKLSIFATYGVNDSPGPQSNSITGLGGIEPIVSIDGNYFYPTGGIGIPGAQYTYTPILDPRYAISGTGSAGNDSSYDATLITCCTHANSAWSVHSGSIALHYELSSSVSADVFYAGQTGSEPMQTPFGYQTDFMPPPGYTGSLPAGEGITWGNYGFGSPSPYTNATSLLEEKITAQLGNGTVKVAALQNRTFSNESLVEAGSAMTQIFGGGCEFVAGPANPSLCPSGGTPVVFNGEMHAATFLTGVTSNNSQASNNRDLLFEYATPLGENMRAGVSFVNSYYNFPITVITSLPAFGFTETETAPSADSQATNEYRVFVGGDPSEKTSLDLSMYFVNADYHVQNPNDATGNTYVDARYSYAAPRLGFVWRPQSAVSVRAAAGGGFAEAPLADLAGAGAGNTNGAPECDLSTGTCTQALTNVNLQPEKSFGFDLGTDIRLPRDTILSFDLYHTNLSGQFYSSTSLGGTCTSPACLLPGAPLYLEEPGNLGQSRYEGLLIDLRHDVPHGIYWALSGGLTRGYVVSVPADFYNTGTCTNCTNLSVVPNVNFNGTFTGVSVPYSQALGTLGYRWSAEKYTDLVATYFGNNNTYFRPAFVELDGYVSYPLAKNASLLVTFRNITGIYDGSILLFQPGVFFGVPTVAGLPFSELGQWYGPRTVILTTNIHF